MKYVGKLFGYGKTNSLSRAQLHTDGKISNVHYGDIHTRLPQLLDTRTTSLPKVAEEFAQNSGDILRRGDVIMADASEDYADIGKAVEISDVDEFTPAVAGLHTLLLRPKKKSAIGFYSAVLKTENVRKQIMKVAVGVSVLGISKSNISNVTLSIPSLPEQQKIASFLTTVDTRIEKLEQKITLLKAYKKGAMQRIFSQQIRFKSEDSEEYREWATVELGSIATIKTGKKDVNQGNPKGIYPFFTCAREHTYSDEYSFEGEAIMIAGNGEVGQCTYYNGKFEAYQRTYVLQDFKIPAKYLFIYLKEAFQAFAESEKQQGSMPYIKLSTLQTFRVPIPSTEELEKITALLGPLDDKMELEGKRLTSAKAWKKGLLQRMFV